MAKSSQNPDQPRKVFDQVSLDELAESIRLHGVITPITVRRARRTVTTRSLQVSAAGVQHARQAGLEDIPAMVLEAEENEVMELALIENLQRQDLNPIEEAEGYERLMKQFGLTREQVGQARGQVSFGGGERTASAGFADRGADDGQRRRNLRRSRAGSPCGKRSG